MNEIGRGALVVTGGGRGIGAEIARQAAQQMIPVAILYRSSEAGAKRLVDEVELFGVRALAVRVDISDERDVANAFAAVDEELGEICGLVNSAVATPQIHRFAEWPADEFEAIVKTNIFGTFFCTREVVKRLSTRTGGAGGAVVSLSSSIGMATGGPGAYVPWSATKAAIETMSLGLAKEVASEGIRVNVVRCGVIDTETRHTQGADRVRDLVATVPMQRIGTAAEVAAAVLWLLSPSASYVTGATIAVAGGL